MSTVAIEPPGASEAVVRAHASELVSVARRFGVSGLRFASPGRLVGHTDEHADELDLATFDADASTMLGAPVQLFSDVVLRNDNVSNDLVTARPL